MTPSEARTVDLVEEALTSLPDHATTDPAVDFHEVKGEVDVVRAVRHRLRATGIKAARERRRTDLVVEDVHTEWKVMSPRQIRVWSFMMGSFRWWW